MCSYLQAVIHWWEIFWALRPNEDTKVWRYIMINAGVISDKIVSSMVRAFGRVGFVEANIQIWNYSYKILK